MCGGVIEDIGDAVSDVVSGAGDALASIDPGPALGDIAASIDPGPAIGQAAESVGEVAASFDPGPAIGQTLAQVDEVVNQLPGGWTLPAAVAAYFAAPYAAPLFAEALGGTALGAEAGAFTTAELLGGAGGAFIPVEGASFALPSALSAAGGAAAPAVTSAATQSAAQSVAASAKAAASAIAQSGSAGETLGLLSNPIIKSALTGGGYGALTGGVTAALTGQDALKGALIGGATGGVLGGGEAAFFPELSKWAAGSVPNAGLLGAGRGAAGGALNTVFGGGDLKQNILYGGIGGGALGAGSEYFFPTAASPSSQTSKGTFGEYTPDPYSPYKGIDTTTPEMLYGADRYDPTYDIARAKTQDYFDASADPSRYWTNTEVADSVKALDQYKLTPDQIRLSLEQEGMYPEAARMAANMSGKTSSEIADKLYMNFGEKIGPAGDIGIEMFKYTDTPLEEQYINQDLQEGYVSQYRAPTEGSSWYSGLGNLGSLLGAKALGGLGGGGGAAAARPMAGGGSYVPKGMVDYAGILNLLAPKTTTRSSLLG